MLTSGRTSVAGFFDFIRHSFLRLGWGGAVRAAFWVPNLAAYSTVASRLSTSVPRYFLFLFFSFPLLFLPSCFACGCAGGFFRAKVELGFHEHYKFFRALLQYCTQSTSLGAVLYRYEVQMVNEGLFTEAGPSHDQGGYSIHSVLLIRIQPFMAMPHS